MRGPEKIVIRSANWLGDSVISIPAVRAVRNLFPSAWISVLAPENLAPLWENEEAVDTVIPFSRPTRLREKVRIVRLLRAGGYDLGILFPNSFESALWFFIGRVRRRLGHRTCWRRLLLNRGVRDRKAGGHQVHRYLDLVRELGDVSVEPQPSIAVSEELRRRANGLLRAEGYSGDAPLVGMNPGSTYGTAKCWPPDRFARLIRLLRERLGAVSVVVGGKNERPLAETIRRESGAEAINMAGRTTVMELAALLSRCAALVTNDTGPMHVACAVGTPVAAVIGPTDPEATGPLGKAVMVRKKAECAPCSERECPTDHRCMTGISVEEVYEAVAELMGEPGSTGNIARS